MYSKQLFRALVLLLFITNCQSIDKSERYFLTESGTDTSITKQRGAHAFGIMDTSNLDFLYRNNIEWITLVPWGFLQTYDDPDVSHHRGYDDYIHRTQFLKERGFKVFLKPHVWINDDNSGKWRSDIYPTSDADWELWKETYSEFILKYAEVAEETNADMYCIGTEFTRLTLEKEYYWRDLIKKVRKIYSGKITYASNWYKEYEKLGFWDELDYIGIQAYFPISNNEKPQIKDLKEGWNRYLPTFKKLSQKHKKQILFTEMGYKSTTDSAMRPWEWIDHAAEGDFLFCDATQANCYSAFFKSVWPQDWFAGVHIWQMRSDHEERYTNNNNVDFTPLGKTAESIISEGFKN